MIDESIRHRVVNRANAVVGLSAAPEHVEDFATFLGGPGEARATCIAMATYRNPKTGKSVSTCGLVRRALEREAEIDDPHLHAPYRTGLAVTDLISFAQLHGAWVTASAPRPGRPGGPLPQVGDMIGLALFGLDAGDHGHVCTLTEPPVINADGTISLVTVDGGQVDKQGRQMIARKHRTWTPRDGHYYDTSKLEDPASGFDSVGERLVDGWSNLDLLPTVAPSSTDPAPPPSSTTSAARTSAEDAAKAGASALVRSPSEASSDGPGVEFIDVSAANGSPDFKRVRAAGIRGVWIHALEGLEDVSAAITKIAPTVAAAAHAGLLVGVYQEVYPRHGRAQDADAQAEQLAAVHRHFACELRPMGVHEDVRQDAIRLDAAARAECVDCARLHRATLRARCDGDEGIFYTGPGYWDLVSKGLDVSDFADALVMVADYRANPAPQIPHGFSRAVLWQYAGGAGVIGHVDGVATVVDRSRSLAPMSTILARGFSSAST